MKRFDYLLCAGAILAGALLLLLGITASAGVIAGSGIALILVGLLFGLQIPQRLDRFSHRL